MRSARCSVRIANWSHAASSKPAQVLLVRFPRDSISADHGDRDEVQKEQRGNVDQAEIEDHVRIDLAGLGACGKSDRRQQHRRAQNADAVYGFLNKAAGREEEPLRATAGLKLAVFNYVGD